MRAGLLALASALLSSSAVFATEPMAPGNIQATFFNGQSFEFWTTLESCNWIHPFDDQGQRRRYDDMPASVNDLIDDPFRSLAGAVKRAGGYAKDRSPFSEFRWADYLRLRIAREQIERDFDRTLALAMDLAQTTEAAALPGWRLHPEHTDRIFQLRPSARFG